jgi:hypothetical protein
MRTLAFFLLVIVLQNVPLQIVGNEPIDLSKKLVLEEGVNDPIPSSLNVRIFQGFGYRHVGWDLDIAYQFRKYFSVGIGIAAHFNKTSFFSASDEHDLNMWSLPVFTYVNIFLLNRENGSLYIHGKVGKSFGINTKSIIPDKEFDAIMIDAGIGYQIANSGSGRHIYFELGQYYATAQGTINSSYNSIIRYSGMEILNITGRIGFKF